MKNFVKVHVITDDDISFIKDDGYENPEDIDCKEYDFDWDYAQMALIDVDEQYVIMWNDNIHSNIENEIDNFLKGFSYANEEYILTEVAMMDEKIKQNYKGERY